MKTKQINLVGGLLLPLVFSLAASAKTIDRADSAEQIVRQGVHVAENRSSEKTEQAEPEDHRLSAHPNDPVQEQPGPEDRRLASNRNEAFAEQASLEGGRLAENRSSAIAEQAFQEGGRLAKADLSKRFAQIRTV